MTISGFPINILTFNPSNFVTYACSVNILNKYRNMSLWLCALLGMTDIGMLLVLTTLSNTIDMG